MSIKIAASDQDIASCWEAMSAFRPHLVSEDFIQQVKTMQQEGYVLLYLSEGGQVVSLAGYRIMHLLYAGRILYVDDLFTLSEHRKKGYAQKLLDYMQEVALQKNCAAIHLDSGSARHQAHKLYFAQGFTIGAFHFNKSLS